MSDPIDYGQYDAGRDCNYWVLDPTLRAAAARAYPDEEFDWAEGVLDEFGEVMGHEVADNADRIDRHGPILHTYDKHGEVRNEVEYHPDQHENERIAYEEFGLTHDAFHAPPGREEPASLTHVLAMQTLLCYADVGFCCPVSMTTGAALVLEEFDDGSLDQYFEGLTSRDIESHIEGAMFLTEKQGGSDVGANEVHAEPQEDGTYHLYGEKWFCSNLDAEGALALARTPDAPEGTRGLSLFLVPRTKPNGEVNDSLFRRLKDKLGTLSVPTGEIEFRGAEAYLVGEEEMGFKYMAEMMNYERLTNATGALGIMGRGLLEAKVRAANREAFGETIQEYPLLRRDLAELTTEYEAATAFTFEAARLMDARAGDDSDEYKLMRLLIPIAKYKTARMSVETASYCMEILGGNGYVREHVTPRLLRDAQVLPIWEGTSNILSLDVLRVLARESAHEVLIPYVDDLLDTDHPALSEAVPLLRDGFTELQTALGTLATSDEDYAQYHAKRLADLLFDVVAGALLVDHAVEGIEDDEDGRMALVATLFARDRFESGYGIETGEKLGDDEFDAIARYGSVAPESLTGTALADD